jgi:hypothetical protein
MTYAGNGSDQGGDAIGRGTLELKDNGTTITATLTKGPGSFRGILVLFIDSAPGGFNSTSSFTGNSPALVRAISGVEVGYNAHAVANFAADFYADYAVAVGVDFGGAVYPLNQAGPDVENSSPSYLYPRDSPNYSTYTFSFDWTQIGLPAKTPTNFFRFQSLYAEPAGSHYTESFESVTSVGQNFWGTLNFSNYNVYGVDPVPEPTNTALMAFGGLFAGAVVLSRFRRRR